VSSPGNVTQMNRFSHGTIPPTSILLSTPDSNLHSSLRTTMHLMSECQNSPCLDSLGVPSSLTHNGMTSSLTDMSTSTRFSLDITHLNPTTEKHKLSETSTLALIQEGAVANCPKRSGFTVSGRLPMPDTREQSSSFTPLTLAQHTADC